MKTRARFWLLPAAVAAVFAVADSTDLNAESPLAGCAVSAPNAKITSAGGYTDTATGKVFGEISGSLAAPLGCAFAVQIDGAWTTRAGASSTGAAAHLFYRDPAAGLFGVTGSYESALGVGTYRLGPEVEAYFGNLSFEAWAGYAFTDSNAQDWFAAVDAAIYPTDDLRIAAGWRHSFGTDVAVGRAELQIRDTPVSVFAEGRVGVQNYSSIKAGINVHLGTAQKGLIVRHRSDDPQNRLFNLLAAQVTGGGGGGGGGGGAGAVCGNGVIEGAEACDDGNTADGDACNATCGAISCASDADCDDSDGASVDICSAGICSNTYPVCGNGVVESPEACDDNNTTNGDGCSATCSIEAGPVCGNGVVESPEQCDDNNLTNGDGCSSTCTLPPPV